MVLRIAGRGKGELTCHVVTMVSLSGAGGQQHPSPGCPVSHVRNPVASLRNYASQVAAPRHSNRGALFPGGLFPKPARGRHPHTPTAPSRRAPPRRLPPARGPPNAQGISSSCFVLLSLWVRGTPAGALRGVPGQQDALLQGTLKALSPMAVISMFWQGKVSSNFLPSHLHGHILSPFSSATARLPSSSQRAA